MVKRVALFGLSLLLGVPLLGPDVAAQREGVSNSQIEDGRQTPGFVSRLSAFPHHVLPVQIVNVNSGKCLDVAGAGTGDNVQVQQFDCIGVRNEEWWLVPVSFARYQIRTGHIGRCLNRANGSSANNTTVQQYSCAGAPEAEHWEFFVLADGAYEIRAPGTSQCLDIAGGSVENGGQAQMFGCIGVANERWRLQPRLDANNVIMHDDQCLHVSGASQANNASVVRTSCTGNTNQRWYFEDAADGSYYIKVKHSGKCLDVPGGSTADGVAVQQFDCTGVDNEKWFFEEDGQTDYFRIRNKTSGKCLQVVFSLGEPRVVQMPCASVASQRWRVGYFMSRQVHQFAIAKADGTDRRSIAETVLDQMVTRMNSVYNRFGVRASYSVAAGDLTNVDDDALYNLGNSGKYLCNKNMQMTTPPDCANLYAADYPTKFVVFPGAGAFSDVGVNFVQLVYPNDGPAKPPPPGGCKYNDVNLAHEFGHYLGLQHTFKASGSVAALSAALRAAGDNQFAAFDGDGLLDTPPEPLENDPDPWWTCSTSSATVTRTLQGTSGPVPVTVPLQNIIGYYYNRNKKITPQQGTIVRALMGIRESPPPPTPPPPTPPPPTPPPPPPPPQHGPDLEISVLSSDCRGTGAGGTVEFAVRNTGDEAAFPARPVSPPFGGEDILGRVDFLNPMTGDSLPPVRFSIPARFGFGPGDTHREGFTVEPGFDFQISVEKAEGELDLNNNQLPANGFETC